MQTKPQLKRPARPTSRNERGAALITSLLISTLLLTAGGALILTTSMSGTNGVGPTAEMHAYYAAEAGLQRALNVLRFNEPPPAGTPAMLDGTTKASFRNAAGTNLGTWLQLPCNDETRCSWIGTTPIMRVGTRGAYSIAVSDPDAVAPPALPKRLRLIVTGYGPNGAKKVLDTIVLQSGLWGFAAPATVTLIGSDDAAATTQLTLDTGNSNSVRYSGNDAASPGDPGYDPAKAGDRPVFGVTPTAEDDARLGINRPNTIIGDDVGTLGDGTSGTLPTPDWLTSAETAAAFVQEMRLRARPDPDGVDRPNDRYFTTATQPAPANVSGLTFIEGNATLGSGNQGSGILVVTGTLNMNGNTSFTGMIFVMGGGTVIRSGAGSGVITGGMVVAKYDASGKFLTPTFITDGGGSSRFQYNSAVVNQALSAVPSFDVKGVVEK
ncbi:MAG TPA: hypothetical protein VE842_16935 [Pyrinomonadaceae bacterium]|jgi:hypothetical protein|nr:hypothetical protein [Pyrinomonadaceae bacterium]